jgi:putative spermidine/putrescine transport system permease protein
MKYFLTNNKNKINIDFIMALPSLVIVIGVTMLVFFNTLKESLGYIPELFLRELTLRYYIEIFTNKVFYKSVFFSFSTALISTTFSTVFGLILVHYWSKARKDQLSSIYQLPIFLSYIASAVLIYNTYSDKGVLYHILKKIGLECQSFNIIYSSSGSAVILLYMFKAIPFIVLSIFPIYLKTDLTYRDVAKNLGCSEMNYIFKILLPICKRGILTSALIIFNYNLFSYEGFYYLGPSNPPSIGVLAYQNYVSADLAKRAAGMAINMTMILVSLGLCIMYYKLIRGKSRGAKVESI